MTAPSKLLTVIVAVLMLGLAGACGNNASTNTTQPSGNCPTDKLPFRATFLPSGFDRTLKQGPGDKLPTIPNVITFHHDGPGGAFIEMLRKGKRTKVPTGAKVVILNFDGAIAQVGNVVAARVKTSRGPCSNYHFEGHGVSLDDMKKFVTGLTSTR